MLRKLRSQSDETKTKLALMGAVVVTIGIVALWIMMLPRTLPGNGDTESVDEVQAPSPLKALVESISNASRKIQKPTGVSPDTEPSVSTPSDGYGDELYDESNPAPLMDSYQGEQVYLEE